VSFQCSKWFGKEQRATGLVTDLLEMEHACGPKRTFWHLLQRLYNSWHNNKKYSLVLLPMLVLKRQAFSYENGNVNHHRMTGFCVHTGAREASFLLTGCHIRNTKSSLVSYYRSECACPQLETKVMIIMIRIYSINSLSTYHVTALLWNLNTNVWRGDILGKSLHEISNDNGIIRVNFTTSSI